jgi:hypothetical protein
VRFLPLGFVDTSAFTAILLTRHRTLLAQRRLSLRENEEDLEILKDWKSAKALFARLKKVAEPHLSGDPAVIVNVHVEVLPADVGTEWAASDDRVWRTRTCLVVSPGGVTYVGPEGAVLPVGQATVIDHTQLCSDVNTGPCTRVHLVVDFLRVVDEPDKD